MPSRWPLLPLTALALSTPAAAMEVTWRATGIVDSFQGTTELLPLPAEVGDLFEIQFTYDDAVADQIPGFPDSGSYPIISLSIRIADASLQIVSPGSGQGQIGIQANAVDPNLWGVTGCLAACDLSDYDSARVNLFFPPNTILSDALTSPPDPAGASVQFGLFSRESSTVEAFLIADLDAITQVPEPAGSAMTALAALAALAGWRRFARAR